MFQQTKCSLQLTNGVILNKCRVLIISTNFKSIVSHVDHNNILNLYNEFEQVDYLFDWEDNMTEKLDISSEIDVIDADFLRMIM